MSNVPGLMSAFEPYAVQLISVSDNHIEVK